MNAVRKLALDAKGYSRMQIYEMEMIEMAQQMFRILMKQNMYNQERVMQLYDRLLYFPPNFTLEQSEFSPQRFKGNRGHVRGHENFPDVWGSKD
ncbi:MAG: hypothetical protein HC912_09120 [Saprospiraceae bacterium]|nr:hypothetical protein [Saprospiraceae bacterium]